MPNDPKPSAEAVALDTDEDAMFTVLSCFDEWFTDGRFDAADECLRLFRVDRMNSQEIVCVLSATNPAKDRLPSRGDFVEQCRARLDVTDPSRVERLLRGLT